LFKFDEALLRSRVKNNLVTGIFTASNFRKLSIAKKKEKKVAYLLVFTAFLTPQLKVKTVRRPSIVLDTAAYICTKKLNPCHQTGSKVKMFQCFFNKRPFCCIKDFFEVNE